MPLFGAPEGENDGGYAVSDYRQVEPSLGTMADLQRLAQALRDEGISLVLDFVFNHTSDEHRWAQKSGQAIPTTWIITFCSPTGRRPTHMTRRCADLPGDTQAAGFTYRAEIDRWVWTTFNSFQWDLNYANPAVFRDMAGEMLFLANAGAEALRLDALAFTWKQMGTNSENLPQAHQLVQAFNALLRIAAPAMLFKSRRSSTRTRSPST